MPNRSGDAKVIVMNLKLYVAALAVGAACVVGCGEEEGEPVGVAQAEPARAEAPPSAPATSPSAPSSAPAAGEAGGPWKVPAGWRQDARQRPMRFATFLIGEGDAAVEVAVSQFPGDVGGLLANVNRWRGQVGLAPVTEAELPSIVQPFENPGFKGVTMRLNGPTQHMLAAAITEEKAD